MIKKSDSVRFAEDANYWSTTVLPSKSQGDLSQLLEDFGATHYHFVIVAYSHNQGWRIAFYFTKAVLTAAESNSHALFGFMELPNNDNATLPKTTAELDVSGVIALLEPPEVLLGLIENTLEK